MAAPLEEYEAVEHDDDSQELPEVTPLEQQTILFYGKPIIVVRLPDGQPGVALRSLCDNLQLESTAQVRRIRRTEAIASATSRRSRHSIIVKYSPSRSSFIRQRTNPILVFMMTSKRLLKNHALRIYLKTIGHK